MRSTTLPSTGIFKMYGTRRSKTSSSVSALIRRCSRIHASKAISMKWWKSEMQWRMAERALLWSAECARATFGPGLTPCLGPRCT